MSTGVHGVLPQEVFHLPNLELLDLSYGNLTARLPKVKWGSSDSLKHHNLKDLKLVDGIPDSVVFLESLTTLAHSNCDLSEPIPRSP